MFLIFLFFPAQFKNILNFYKARTTKNIYPTFIEYKIHYNKIKEVIMKIIEIDNYV